MQERIAKLRRDLDECQAVLDEKKCPKLMAMKRELDRLNQQIVSDFARAGISLSAPPLQPVDKRLMEIAERMVDRGVIKPAPHTRPGFMPPDPPEPEVTRWPSKYSNMKYVEAYKAGKDILLSTTDERYGPIAQPSTRGDVICISDPHAAEFGTHLLELAGVTYKAGVDVADGMLTVVVTAALPDGTRRIVDVAECATDAVPLPPDMIGKQRVLELLRERHEIHGSSFDVQKELAYLMAYVGNIEVMDTVDAPPTGVDDDSTADVQMPEPKLRVLRKEPGTISIYGMPSGCQIDFFRKGDYWHLRTSLAGIDDLELPSVIADICTIAGVNIHQPVIDWLCGKRDQCRDTAGVGDGTAENVYSYIIRELKYGNTFKETPCGK